MTHLFCTSVLSALCIAAFAADEQAGQPGGLAASVHAIFARSCAMCHGPQVAHPPDGFGYVLDLKRLVDGHDLVVPGEPGNSKLFQRITSGDPDEHMPPPSSSAQQLSTDEIETVRQWIAAGAPPLAGADETAALHGAQPAQRGASGSAAEWLGRWHVAVLHLPIGLLLAAALAQVVLLFAKGSAWLDGATRWCLWVGAPGAVISVLTGLVHAGYAGYADETVELHESLGITTCIVALVSLVGWEIAQRTGNRAIRLVSIVLLIAAAALVAAAGHTGGVMVFGASFLAWPW